MARISESDRASTAAFLDSLPGVLKPGDRLSFQSDGQIVQAEFAWCDAKFVWVQLADGALWPIYADEVLPPF